jgi:hypothetical protein
MLQCDTVGFCEVCTYYEECQVIFVCVLYVLCYSSIIGERITGFLYDILYIFYDCCTLCCTSLYPPRRGGGGGLAIADSQHKLGTLLGSSRGYKLPAGVG